MARGKERAVAKTRQIQLSVAGRQRVMEPVKAQLLLTDCQQMARQILKSKSVKQLDSTIRKAVGVSMTNAGKEAIRQLTKQPTQLSLPTLTEPVKDVIEILMPKLPLDFQAVLGRYVVGKVVSNVGEKKIAPATMRLLKTQVESGRFMDRVQTLKLKGAA